MVAGIRNTLVPALVITVGTVLLPLSGCKIVHNDQRASTTASSAPAASGFDAAGYVDGVWKDKVVPHFDTKSNDLSKVIEAINQDPDKAGEQFGNRADAEGSPWSFAVKSQATVVSVNTESRAGTVVVNIGGKQEVTLQIGPVVKGSAIRDSLPFFSFADVTNQIEYAQVGRSFNEKAMKSLQDVIPKLKAGSKLEFEGAISITGPTENFLVTPVAIKPAGGGAS